MTEPVAATEKSSTTRGSGTRWKPRNVQLVVVKKGEKPVPWLGATFDAFVPVRQFKHYTVYANRGAPPRRQ